MRTWCPLGGLAAAACLAMLALAPADANAQVDYHRAQQAGKVWERKNDERNRQQRVRGDRRNSEGVPFDAPLTDADRAWTLSQGSNRADYERLRRSVGRDNAERWLELTARQARAKR